MLNNNDIYHADTVAPYFVPDVAGSYVLELEVSDGEDNDYDNVLINVESSQTCVPASDPDLNDDGVVNVLDVSMVGSCFGQDPADNQQCSVADVNCDGVVDMLDINYVVNSLGQNGF